MMATVDRPVAEGGRRRSRWPFTPAGAYASVAGPAHAVNEDAAALPDDVPAALTRRYGWLFAVADGVGGGSEGAAASRSACRALFNAYYGHAGAVAPPDRLTAAVAEAHHAVAALGATVASVADEGDLGSLFAGAPPAAPPATTLVAAVVVDGTAWVAHVGDSRAYLVRDGAATALTRDHSLVAGLLARAAITAAEAAVHPQRGVLTRALGTADAAPDVARHALEIGDRLVLASDGVFGVLDPPELAGAVVQRAARRGAGLLAIKAVAAQATDDATALVVDPLGGWPPRWVGWRPLVASPASVAVAVAVVLVVAAAVWWSLRAPEPPGSPPATPAAVGVAGSW